MIKDVRNIFGLKEGRDDSTTEYVRILLRLKKKKQMPRQLKYKKSFQTEKTKSGNQKQHNQRLQRY